MRNEELAHAPWIEYLGAQAANGAIVFHEDTTRACTLQAFLDHIGAVRQKAQSASLTPMDALSIAADLEDSLLESRVFDHVQSDSAETVRILKLLRAKTMEHRNKARWIAQRHRALEPVFPPPSSPPLWKHESCNLMHK